LPCMQLKTNDRPANNICTTLNLSWWFNLNEQDLALVLPLGKAIT